jgi:hypothetical protein
MGFLFTGFASINGYNLDEFIWDFIRLRLEASPRRVLRMRKHAI